MSGTLFKDSNSKHNNFFDSKSHLYPFLKSKGEEGNALYCVFSGSVNVYSETKTETGNVKQSLITQVLPYDVVGELSLLYEQKRVATAIANENSELLVLDKKIISPILKVTDKKLFLYTIEDGDGINRLENHTKTLRAFSLLQECSDTYLKRLAAKCYINKFRTLTVIMTQGQKVDGIYFIKSGRVKVSLLKEIEK